MKTRIHINLSVRDIEQSTQFYSLLFGQQPTKTREDYANFRLAEPDLHLALVKSPEHAAGDSLARHYGVELFDDAELTDWRGRLEKAGVALKIEEEVTCCYAIGNKFWARDPDGNDWEFWVRSAEAEVMKEAEAGSASGRKADDSACCTPAQVENAVAAAEAKGESACCLPAEASAKAGTPESSAKSECC